MNLKLTEEQEILKRTARQFFQAELPKSLVKKIDEGLEGYPPGLWKKMAELGWLGMVFPEKYGGNGMNFLDITVLLEEMGRACLPSPFFATVILGGLTILRAGNEEQKERFLSSIAKGDLILSLALSEPEGDFEPTLIRLPATVDGRSYILNGAKLFVLDAHVSDYIICVARTKDSALGNDGITLFIVDAKKPGISSVLLKTVGRDKQCQVIFGKIKVNEKSIIGQLDNGWMYMEDVLQKAAVAKCAEMLGGAKRVLELTIDHVKNRSQFGRPLGSLQAVQHHCANMLIDIQTCELLTYQAASQISKGLPYSECAAMSKAWVSEAYRRVTDLGHQVQGGIAFTLDHDMPLYFRRSRGAALYFGDADFHREKLAVELGL